MIAIDLNSDSVNAYLADLARRLDHPSELLASIGQEIESRVSARFETETDPTGQPWAPWKQSTIDSYPEDGNHRILDRYGDMLASLNHQVEGDAVLIGFGDPVATYHIFGTEDMERRDPLFADPEQGTLGHDDELAILDIATTYLGSL